VTKPADFPPPWQAAEAIGAPSDPDPIEVGVLVVGAGPAGLAASIRLGQLLAEDPGGTERFGEVPVAVLEKGKAAGSHLLSGAVIDPGPLRRLVGEDAAFPSFGQVTGESVLFMTETRALRIPTPPTMHNKGNVVVSVSRLGRWLGEQAEGLGATMLPETAAVQLLVEDGRVVGVRTGDKGRGREGEETARFEPGSDIRAQVTILAEGTQGYLTGAALEEFGLAGASPQVWALGVKEVWRVPRPLGRVIHTMGWPLRGSARYREFGGSFIYPLGDDMVSIGLVVGLDYRDASLSVHDLLQELKTHPQIRPLLEGGERLAWGAKTIPEGGFVALPSRLYAPGLLLCGDAVGLVNVPALKGVHYAIESGRLAAEAAWAGELSGYDQALRASFVWDDLRVVRNMRQAFGSGFLRGAAVAGAATVSKGRFPGRDRPTERDADQSVFAGDRAASYPVPDGELTFDKLSSVFLSGNRTRDDQPNHIRIQTRVPRDLAELWVSMCPAQVYEVAETDSAASGGGTGDGEGAADEVEVRLAPSNCVQCGAITAKGGRLTPPEGGSGPEYTLT
jgi:electron-transferring-flavoprotein dehydrogenase